MMAATSSFSTGFSSLTNARTFSWIIYNLYSLHVSYFCNFHKDKWFMWTLGLSGVLCLIYFCTPDQSYISLIRLFYHWKTILNCKCLYLVHSICRSHYVLFIMFPKPVVLNGGIKKCLHLNLAKLLHVD